MSLLLLLAVAKYITRRLLLLAGQPVLWLPPLIQGSMMWLEVYEELIYLCTLIGS